MHVKIEDVCLVLLFGILTGPSLVSSLTGLCENDSGSRICSACNSLSETIGSLSRDCCGDPDVHAVCSYCFKNPESCQRAGQILSDILGEMETYEQRQIRSGENQPQLPYHVAPQRRAKYFLGKRNGISQAWDDSGDDEMTEPWPVFNKKALQPFLGKRFYDREPVDEFDHSGLVDKRVKLFLGKRDVSFDSEGKEDSDIMAVGPSGDLWDDEKSKRKVSPFLGKRGDVDNQMGDKEDSKRARASPFLGKRGGGSQDTGSVANKRGSSFFLGKRADLNNDSVDKLEDIYVSPLTRRAKYFLGKRTEGTKRQKYFLGKRAEGQSKRQKFFLGKRGSL